MTRPPPPQILPELPPLPTANLVLFSSSQWNGVRTWLEAIYAALDIVLTVQAPIVSGLELLLPLTQKMETLLTFAESQAANTVATTEVLDDIQRQIAQTKEAVDKLADNPTPAQIAEVRDNTARLVAASAALDADDPAPEPDPEPQPPV